MKANYSNSAILDNATVNAYVQKIKENRDIAYDLNKFLKFSLQYILTDLKIDKYLIGGTTALVMGYDIPIRKEMKDIDVIVPAGTIDRIRKQIEASPFYSTVEEHKNYRLYDHVNSHIEIKCIEGFAVDIIEVEGQKYEELYRDAPLIDGLLYCPLINILETKNKWRRHKDLEDLFFIEKWFENLNIKK